MIRASLALLALAAGLPAVAVPRERLTSDRAAIVYHQCLVHAAARLSRRPLDELAIFPEARRLCISTRIAAQTGAANVVEAGEMLDRIDAEARAAFPERTRRVRAMRQRFEAGEAAAADPSRR